MKKKHYELPLMEVIKLKNHFVLLAGSNGDQGEGQGSSSEPIGGGEGD